MPAAGYTPCGHEGCTLERGHPYACGHMLLGRFRNHLGWVFRERRTSLEMDVLREARAWIVDRLTERAPRETGRARDAGGDWLELEVWDAFTGRRLLYYQVCDAPL